jgi:sec-independent protein translocase protein TatA
MPAIGPMELIILLTLALLIFGPKKLPELGRSIGTGMREFKQSITGGDAGARGTADVRLAVVEDTKPTI